VSSLDTMLQSLSAETAIEFVLDSTGRD